MANEIITTLHPDQDPDTNLYPNVKKENIPDGSIDRSKLGNDINGLLNNIGKLVPSGTATSNEIIDFNEDKGIYIGTDIGHWYYWDGTHYVDGGIYQAILDLNIEFEKGTIHTDGTEINDPPYNEIRARSNFIYLNKGDCLVFNHTFKYDYNIMEYNDEQIFQSDDGWTNIAQWIAPKNMYVRIVVRYNENYLNLINRAVAYWHRNDLYELKDNRIIFDLKDVKSGDTLIISSNDNQRWSLTTFDKPYGYYTTPNYIYDSGWIKGDGTILTHTIESNAKNALVAWAMADNSNITSKGWMLNSSISVRKTNDENILDDDMDELSNDGVLINRVGSFNVIKNTKYNDIIRWGHRGMNTLAPENTMPSFEMAYKMGYRCMECDVRLTLDDIPVILHDNTINRTARNIDGSTISGDVYVANTILPKLQNGYDFGIFFSDQFKDTKILTFEEFIIWAKSKNCYVHLDLLGGAFSNTTKLDILYNLVAQYGMLNNCLWEIKDITFVSYLQGKGISNDNIMYNPSDIYSTSLIDNIVSLGLKKISMVSNNTFDVVNYALSKGLDVYIWGDDNISTLFKYYKYGVSGFYFNSMIVDYYLQDYNYVLSQRKDM